jgi:hypothetical protein
MSMNETEIPKTPAQRVAEYSKDLADFLVSMEERVTDDENISDAVAVEICGYLDDLKKHIDQRDKVLQKAFAVIQTENADLRERVTRVEADNAALTARVTRLENEMQGARELKTQFEEIAPDMRDLVTKVRKIFSGESLRPPSPKNPPKPRTN